MLSCHFFIMTAVYHFNSLPFCCISFPYEAYNKRSSRVTSILEFNHVNSATININEYCTTISQKNTTHISKYEPTLHFTILTSFPRFRKDDELSAQSAFSYSILLLHIFPFTFQIAIPEFCRQGCHSISCHKTQAVSSI